jgi:histidine ammonia-lyase
MTAAIKLKKIVGNTTHVLSIEAMAAAQALDFLAPLKTSRRLQVAHAAIRAVSPRIDHDRAMYADFLRIAQVLTSGQLAQVLL